MGKIFLLLAVGLVMIVLGLSVYLDYSTSAEEDNIKAQLVGVENKITDLPELEKDIFTKCMEGKEATAMNIRACQESTQEQAFTLSQDLVNLKKTLEDRLSELQQ